MIGSFKTAMVEYFYERYAAIAEMAAAAASTVVAMVRRGVGGVF